MRKKILVTLIVGFLLLLGVWFIFQFTQISKTKQASLDAQKIANVHMARMVGDEFFHKNFVLDPKSYQKLEGGSHKVHYEFLPLKKYGIPSLIPVFFSKEKLERNVTGHHIPNCMKDPSLCEFNLTDGEFTEILKKQGVNPSDIQLRPPYLSKIICKDLQTGKRLLIDYRTKETKVEMDPSIDCFPAQIIIEEEGILKIKSTHEYKDLVKKYGVENISVKAVESEHLNSMVFLKQIDTRFADMSGCIIVVEAPHGEGFVYQQDETFNTIHRITLMQFKEGLKKIDPKMVENFYSRLK